MNLHVMVTSSLESNAGGVETWLQYFLEELSVKQCFTKIFVYAFKRENIHEKIYESLKNNNIDFILTDIQDDRGIKNIIKYNRKTIEYFKKNAIQGDRVLIIGSIVTSPLLYSIKKIIKKKKIITYCWIRSKALGEYKARRPFVGNFVVQLEDYILGNVDYIITNGKDTLDFYIEKYPQYEQKIKMIPNAIRIEKFLDIPIADKVNKAEIIYLGRYMVAKGFDSLIKLANLNKQENFRILSYGQKNDSSNFDLTFVDNHGAYNIEILQKILQKHDIYLFLNYEQTSGGLSHALLEVMAAGKLILAWNNSVHGQVLNEHNSILIEEGNIDLLYQTLINLQQINDLELLQKRIQARENSKKYSVEQHVQSFISL